MFRTVSDTQGKTKKVLTINLLNILQVLCVLFAIKLVLTKQMNTNKETNVPVSYLLLTFRVCVSLCFLQGPAGLNVSASFCIPYLWLSPHRPTFNSKRIHAGCSTGKLDLSMEIIQNKLIFGTHAWIKHRNNPAKLN